MSSNIEATADVFSILNFGAFKNLHVLVWKKTILEDTIQELHNEN